MNYKVKALFDFTDKETKLPVKKDDEFVCSEERKEELLNARAIEVLEEVKKQSKKSNKKGTEKEESEETEEA